jgi:hypothetical protein
MFLEPSELKEKEMDNIKMLSFDMDGTITDLSFVESVWLEGVPRLFSQKNRMSFQNAKTFVKSEYDKVGKERLEWYSLDYWVRKLSLDASPKEILNSFQHRIKTFPEVKKVSGLSWCQMLEENSLIWSLRRQVSVTSLSTPSLQPQILD